MQIIKQGLFICLCLSMPLISVNCSSNRVTKEARLVEVWSGAAHDGLTQKLVFSLENEFKSSKEFIYSYGEKPGTLIVYVPDAVKHEVIGNRIKIMYTFEFLSTSRKKSKTIEGSCYEDSIEECTLKVVNEAKIVRQNMR